LPIPPIPRPIVGLRTIKAGPLNALVAIANGHNVGLHGVDNAVIDTAEIGMEFAVVTRNAEAALGFLQQLPALRPEWRRFTPKIRPLV
jgi:hypothetical protein